jgi:hypothetical protein
MLPFADAGRGSASSGMRSPFGAHTAALVAATERFDSAQAAVHAIGRVQALPAPPIALRRYTFSSMQQYRTRYLLAKFTQFVDMAFKGIATPGPLREYFDLEIEHILPNNPEEALRQSFAQTSTGKDYEEYKIRLGNLTLLEKPINIIAGNDFFEKKKAEYVKSANYLTRSIVALSPVGKNTSISRINERLLSFDKWTAFDIDRRQEMLIGLAKEVWKTRSMQVA